jgi:PAS domain S-box-containing protein
MSVARAEGTGDRAADAGLNGAGAARVEPLPRVTRTARSLGAAATALGGVYFGLWLGGVAARWSAAGVLTMKANMALALALAGAALVLLSGRVGPRRRVAATIASGIVLMVGVLTLAEHAFRVDLGIDQLFAWEPPGAVATVSPNRIGPPGSISLTLVGAGLLALARRHRAAVYLGIATALVVLVPAVGFLYGIGGFYGTARLGIAWPTVIALLSVAAGITLAAADESTVLWRDDPGGLFLRRLLLPAALVPLLVGFLEVQGDRHGLYDAATGTGLFVLSLVLFFSVLLWVSAAQVSAADAERRRAADALREREERLRGAMQRLESLLENSPLAVIEWSSGDFRVVRWSDGATQVFGWTAREVVGRRIDELNLVYPEDRPVVEQVMDDMLTGRRPRNVNRNRNVRKDGAVIHCEWYNSTVTDSAGRLTAVLSLVLDVTDRKRNEEALREADQRKSDFLGVLSHELRNPLAPIRNSIHILDRAPPDSEQARRAKDVIRRQTTQLARLIDDLLDVTRIARGKVELHRQRIDVGEIVRRTVEDHRGVFLAQGIELQLEGSGPAWVDGDETRVAQIVGNLLQNAAKFGNAGGRVTVRVGAVEGAAEISVRDDGIGMSAELMGRLFEPFVQADRGLARTKGGLGLGLALVKGLVELHGGSVRATSDGPGRGSELVVRLALAQPLEPGRSAPEPAAPAPVPGLRILVIEDNVDAAETLAAVLRAEGHRVDVAHDGRSGLALAREHEPDVVVCDIGLPDVDGYEVARTIKGGASRGSPRLIALTGYAQAADRATAEQAGFDAHLAKPPRLDTLLAMLRASKRER